VPLTRIGQIRKGKGVSLVSANGEPIKVDGAGFDHFTAS
jgi:thiamine monophosphate kinase